MKRLIKILLSANLLAATALAFTYPHLMIAPGKLIPGHNELESDCFACHTPFIGASPARCVNCHETKHIGQLTTQGQPIDKPLTDVPFHQQLREQNCVACHSDHAGVKRWRAQGRFDHALLQPQAIAQCQQCHHAPTDALHEKVSAQCSQCHRQQQWQPAIFDHDAYFSLDRDHDVRCVTCHVRNDYSRYTCYGCHEHTTQNIRREHIEEGIRDYQNCVECHRNADEHDIRGHYGRREDRHGDEKHHDD
jgi:hypothetical protein